MELGSVAHKHVLLNLRLLANSTTNVGIGEIKDVQVVLSGPRLFFQLSSPCLPFAFVMFNDALI